MVTHLACEVHVRAHAGEHRPARTRTDRDGAHQRAYALAGGVCDLDCHFRQHSPLTYGLVVGTHGAGGP